jgi:hypothetical protein
MRKHGVSYFKSVEYEIKIDSSMPLASMPDPSISKPVSPPTSTPSSAASAPPVEINIPHHVNEVKNLLKLSDNELVDKLFPDHTQEQSNAVD